MSPSNGHDPFACFGDSSSDDEDDCPQNDSETVANSEEGHRLKEKSNADQPIMTDILNEYSSLEVFDAGPNSGKGLRSTVVYKRGEEILRESAAMRIPNLQSASSQEEAELKHRNAVQRAYNAMHETTKASFMNLSSCNEDTKTPQGVYDTNSFRLGNDDNNGGLFLTIARMNHACRPNVNHFWRTDLQQTLVFATRDIEIGEELYTTYGPGECMGTKSRQEYLNDRFSFQCCCEMCEEGNTDDGDERMIEIQSLHEDIALQSSSYSGVPSNDVVTAALDSIEKCLALMKRQGIGAGVFTKSILHNGHDICLAAGDNERARSYLLSELGAVKDSEGFDSPKAIQIEQILNHFHKGTS
mmetsp:Transcript_21526/g.46802  ORF Transcript_21526/g.46802 Transcript_21526/m.46802 type:complete len:357 (-) Transcript_21526:94-1164(-)